ncbi:helix-turn-helix domain-containing protein [Burkholderia diffusa]|uniref:helix-turn-helix domain-containing protein n=1 Tax=Burkholderia diffusa TaxID=488732 RepID=UPI000753EE1C|nr:helix-turn-helix domain-containing protein [Burkholderia diffusa]KVC43940.1 XRE family transcriptional regulator [Burkholderia diffusa]KVG32967.1 XRE family transcriptional regulator [Burkholderia diffusa]
MSEPQPTNGAETNAAKPAQAGLESLTAVGSRLAQLREAKGWTVDDVSARLKVAPQKLRALEAGDISHLPGVTFALGVVRSYAKMLGVDPEPFAQALRRERGVPEVDLSMPASSGTDLPRGRVSIPLGGSSRHHPWLWGTAIVVVAVIAVLMWHTGGDSSSWLARFKGGGETEHASAASAPAAASAEEAAAGGASTAVGNDVQAQIAASAAASQPVASAASAPAPTAAVLPASQPIVATAAASSAAAPAQPASVVVAAGQSMVELKVKQDCWFSVRDKNGKELFSALVRAGDTKQVAGDGPFKVTIGNKAGLDTVAFDGKPVDPAKYSAARGNVARFTLP